MEVMNFRVISTAIVGYLVLEVVDFDSGCWNYWSQ
jgi:hypothetical protein